MIGTIAEHVVEMPSGKQINDYAIFPNHGIWQILKDKEKYNVDVKLRSKVAYFWVKITDEGITIKTSYGITKTLGADSIILTLPSTPNTTLADSLKGRVSEVYAIGDCNKSGVIVDAVADGNLTSRKI